MVAVFRYRQARACFEDNEIGSSVVGAVTWCGYRILTNFMTGNRMAREMAAPV